MRVHWAPKALVHVKVLAPTGIIVIVISTSLSESAYLEKYSSQTYQSYTTWTTWYIDPLCGRRVNTKA